jgi:hypothetical protein
MAVIGKGPTLRRTHDGTLSAGSIKTEPLSKRMFTEWQHEIARTPTRDLLPFHARVVNRLPETCFVAIQNAATEQLTDQPVTHPVLSKDPTRAWLAAAIGPGTSATLRFGPPLSGQPAIARLLIIRRSPLRHRPEHTFQESSRLLEHGRRGSQLEGVAFSAANPSVDMDNVGIPMSDIHIASQSVGADVVTAAFLMTDGSVRIDPASARLGQRTFVPGHEPLAAMMKQIDDTHVEVAVHAITGAAVSGRDPLFHPHMARGGLPLAGDRPRNDLRHSYLHIAGAISTEGLNHPGIVGVGHPASSRAASAGNRVRSKDRHRLSSVWLTGDEKRKELVEIHERVRGASSTSWSPGWLETGAHPPEVRAFGTPEVMIPFIVGAAVFIVGLVAVLVVRAWFPTSTSSFKQHGSIERERERLGFRGNPGADATSGYGRWSPEPPTVPDVRRFGRDDA